MDAEKVGVGQTTGRATKAPSKCWGGPTRPPSDTGGLHTREPPWDWSKPTKLPCRKDKDHDGNDKDDNDDDEDDVDRND